MDDRSAFMSDENDFQYEQISMAYTPPSKKAAVVKKEPDDLEIQEQLLSASA